MLPSTVAIALFYSDSSYVHATPADVKALAWVKDNTPPDAVVCEEPAHFVRLPVMTGRYVAYAGNVYAWQYRHVDWQPEMDGILPITGRDALYQSLLKNYVDYVFVGSKERGYPFACAIEGHPKMPPVYDRDGVKIYKVDAP
jgi:uncharacterized membrane protein